MGAWFYDVPLWANFLLGYGFGSVIRDAVTIVYRLAKL